MEQNQVSNTEVTVTNAAVIPAATFAAFKEEEKVSFIRAYDPKVQAIPGYRHAIIRYRVTDGMKAKGTVEKPAQMVTIPQVTLPEDSYMLPEVAAKVLIGTLEDAQDIMIKGMIEEKKSMIHWNEVDLDSTFAAMTAVRVSQRLTREQVEAWAKVALLDVITARAKQQNKGTEPYFQMYGALAAAVPNIGQEVAMLLDKLLKDSKCDDDMAKVLSKKLHTILNPEIGKGL